MAYDAPELIEYVDTATGKTKINVRFAIASGRYTNKVPYSVGRIPVDEDRMTVAMAKRHEASEDARIRAQKEKHRAEERRLNDLLKHDLEAENDIEGNPKADRLWDIAWSQGHSGGYNDVVNCYDEFVDLIK